MSEPTDPKTDFEFTQARLSIELRKELGPWVRRHFYGVVVLGTVVGFVGVPAVVQFVVGNMVEQELEASQEDFRALRALALDAATDAMVAAKNASNATDKVTLELATAQKSIDEAIVDARAATILARQAADESRIALETAAEVGRQLANKTEPTRDVLTDNDKAAIRIRQDATPTNDTVPNRSINYVALTYSLDVDKAKADSPKSRIIAHVEKVEYVFDERWFKPPVRTRTNKLQDFSYAIRVWGSTRVQAAIYLTNPSEILVLEGRMNLRETTFLEPKVN